MLSELHRGLVGIILFGGVQHDWLWKLVVESYCEVESFRVVESFHKAVALTTSMHVPHLVLSATMLWSTQHHAQVMLLPGQ